jgi:hypothetical protein
MTHTMHAHLTSGGTQLQVRNLDGSGLGTPTAYQTGETITGIAGTDGPDHAHAVWTNLSAGGVSSCTAADVRWQSPTLPQVTSTQHLSDDCHGVRNDTGPLPSDGMAIVWTTAAGAVMADYISFGGDMTIMVSAKGRAPRVRYDGTIEWLAWIDQTSGADELRFSTFDLASGTLVSQTLTGWVPAGDEAFELVQLGTTAYLVLLSPDSLTFLGLCVGPS